MISRTATVNNQGQYEALGECDCKDALFIARCDEGVDERPVLFAVPEVCVHTIAHGIIAELSIQNPGSGGGGEQKLESSRRHTRTKKDVTF